MDELMVHICQSKTVHFKWNQSRLNINTTILEQKLLILIHFPRPPPGQLSCSFVSLCAITAVIASHVTQSGRRVGVARCLMEATDGAPAASEHQVAVEQTAADWLAGAGGRAPTRRFATETSTMFSCPDYGFNPIKQFWITRACSNHHNPGCRPWWVSCCFLLNRKPQQQVACFVRKMFCQEFGFAPQTPTASTFTEPKLQIRYSVHPSIY